MDIVIEYQKKSAKVRSAATVPETYLSRLSCGLFTNSLSQNNYIYRVVSGTNQHANFL